jgi:hypothetical protein
MPTRALPGSPQKKQESKEDQETMGLLAKKLRPLGFRSGQHGLIA